MSKDMSIEELMNQAAELVAIAKAKQAQEAAKHEPYIHSEVFELIKGLDSKSTWWTRIRVAVAVLRAAQMAKLKPEQVKGLLTERTMPGTAGKRVSTRVEAKAKGKGILVQLSDGDATLSLEAGPKGPVKVTRDATVLPLIA